MLFEFGGIFRKVWRVALILGTFVIGTSTLLVAPVSAATGINQQLNFQGRLLNAQGAVVTDGYYNVEFKIYQDGTGTAAGNPGGTLKWTEDWLNSNGNGVRVMNGYISVQLGSLNPFGNSVDWNQDTIWLSVNIGNTNVSCTPFASCSGDGEMLPMKRLSAVPYALNAAKLGGLTAAGFIQNTTTVQTATNMAIDGTARADTSILTPSIDTNTAVALNIGTTNATSINLNQNVTVAANKSLTLAGGTTANRPASPTEGMLWYDTTTKQLLVYSNGKWQTDRNSSTKIVAASNASQALRDGADYVATGTGDQAVINNALTAAAGGKVYLTEGTFTINGSISVPNNTTLAGAGSGTIITIPNSFNADINALTNTTTGGNGTGITIQDLRLEGNGTNQTSGVMQGIYFTGLGSGTGSTAVQGGKVTAVWSNNWLNNGISVVSGANTIIANSYVRGNLYGVVLSNSSYNTIVSNLAQGNSAGIYINQSSSTNNTITGNTTQGNTNGIVLLSSASGNTITGNTTNGNTYRGIYLSTGTANNVVTGNVIQDNGSYGIHLNSSATNTVSSNKLYNNGGMTTNNAIYLDASDSNTITGNNVTDSSATTTNHAINISNSTSDTNYLADNTLGGSTLNDLGTGTTYGGQLNAAGNFLIQPAGTIELMKNTNVTGTLSASTSVLAPSVDRATAGTLTIGTNGTNTTAITIGSAAVTTTIAGNTAVTLNATTGTTMVCQNTTGLLSTCDATYLTPTATNFIQNGTAQQASSNFNISGTGTATTFVAANLDATNGSTALTIGTTSSSIDLKQNVTVATGKTLSLAGDTRSNITTNITSPTEGMMVYDTTNKQLLVYANGKWQTDRNSSTKIVAASNASQALRDGADYVATGTGDQAVINNALTAAAGGKVYLTEGTFTINNSISIPDNTILAGAGQGTIIAAANMSGSNLSMIINTNQNSGNPGTNVIVQDMTLNGRSDINTTGAQYGVFLHNIGTAMQSGISDRSGATVRNVQFVSFRTDALKIQGAANSTFTNNKIYGVSGNGSSGIYAQYLYYSTIADNMITGNYWGLRLSGAADNAISGNVFSGSLNSAIVSGDNSSANTITANSFVGNSKDIDFNATTSSIVSANSFNGSGWQTIVLDGASSNNTIAGNNFREPSGSTHTNAIIVTNDSDNNSITGNTVIDAVISGDTNSGCSTDCYAISIVNANVNGTYLAANTLGSGISINDAGTGTIYGGQVNAAGNYVIQPAGTIELAKNTNVSGTISGSSSLTLGTASTTDGSVVFRNSTNANTLTLKSAPQTGNYTLTLPNLTGDAEVCTSLNNCGASVHTDDFIQNQNIGDQAANFRINGTGQAVTLIGTTSITTPLIDTISATALNIGTNNATSINLSQNVTVAAGKSLTLAGGNTASRPASPTEGMLYYDTDTKQLLIYNNGKWKAEGSGTVLVAANDSSAADKAAADFVATGTDDHTIINNAVAAADPAGSGRKTGKVYLFAGTYTIGNSITLPNNTTLAGAGRGTVITLPNSFNTTINAITNTGNTGMTIQDLRLEGNRANQTTGTMYGIYLNSVGSNSTSGSATQGAKIANVWANGWRSSAILLNQTSATAVTGSIAQNNGNVGFFASGSNNTFTNNIAQGNAYGFWLTGIANTTVTGNNVLGNTTYGIYVLSSSNGNTIANNKIHDNGGATTNNGLYLVSSSNNIIAGNAISDTSSTVSNYGINITDSASSANYLANNTLGTGSVNDVGTGTIYAGQYSSSTAFLIQPATNITVGNASTTTTIQGSLSVTPQTSTSTTLLCTNAGVVSTCDAATVLAPTATNFIRNQNTSAQAANSWINGSARSDTSVLTPIIDTATATTLSIGNTTASSISIGKSSISTSLTSSTINVGTSGSTTNILGAAQTTSGQAGNSMVIQGSNGLNGNGGAVTVQGGNANGTGTLGGNLTLAGGTGTTSNGLVILGTSAFNTNSSDSGCYASGADSTSTTNCTIAQASVNNYASVIVGFSNDGQTAFMPNPSILTAGRVVYVTASATTKDFTLSVNGGGAGNQIAMRKNTTATMIWNGSAWTAAGASSSTTLQAAYDNTLQSAGGAELVVSKTNATNGLTIRDSSTNSVNGALLTVQSSSAANLFSVNSNVTEYTSNSGAEAYSGSTSTFPASTWVSLTGSTVARNVTTTNIATGQGSAQVTTSTTAGSGIKNVLATSLTPGQHYNVSFSAKLASGTFTDLGVYYSINGTTDSVTCTTNQAIKTSVWTKVNCTFTAPTSGITSTNSINIRQINSGTIRTFYVDNISVTIAADYNYATDGDVDDAANFATNWPYTTGIGSGSTTRNGSDGFNASSSAGVTITAGAANAGLRNKLSINPLASTLYRVSVYAKSSNAFNDFKIRYSPNGGTNYVDCVDYNTQTLTTSSWTQVTCYMTTDATAVSNPYIYFVESTSSARTFYVDAFSMTLASSSTPNVQIGSGSNGGPTTLFTLDKGASAPIAANNDALLGSMYYDTTLGKLQCYEADGWGACGSSPDNIVTISPEYTNAVMHGTGVGTMTSDICSDALDINDGTSGQSTICGTNETYNLYKWTSPQATPQTYSIYVTYQLPATFKEFSSGQTSVMGRTDNANSTVQYQIYRSNSSTGMTPCGSAVTVSTGAQTSWQPGQATGAADPSTCSFTAGDSIVFKISMTSSSNANAYIGNLGFTFSNR